MAHAAGVETWVTSRSPEGRALAEKLGARRTFGPNEKLPRRVDVVVDNIGKATWEHSLQSVRAGGTVVAVGVTSGDDASANLLRLVSDKITVMGSIMGTLEEMNNMIRLVINAGIKPEIGAVMPMEEAKEAFLAMVEGRTSGKTVFTRWKSKH
jgi:D-arabinose 1-dehydrogenase-like Zn-dependent alcohol dehydrogenase